MEIRAQLNKVTDLTAEGADFRWYIKVRMHGTYLYHCTHTHTLSNIRRYGYIDWESEDPWLCPDSMQCLLLIMMVCV